jgi:hypothetical protein
MKDEYISELLTVVRTEVQKKYCYMNEVHRLTKELSEGLSSDDKLVTNMVLEMRGKELEKISGSDVRIQQLFSGALDNIQEQLHIVLSGTAPADIADEAEQNMLKQIADTVQATKRIWKQTVEIDRVLSRRLAGSDSYYRK